MMVYVDVYSIMMNDLTIDLWIEGEYESVCNRFDMNIDVAMAKNAHLWEEIRNREKGEGTYNMQMEVSIRLLPVIFGLKKKEYLFIMSILFFNINYDDLNDRYYLQNQQNNQIQEQQIAKQYQDQQVMMRIQLDMENMSLFIQNDDELGTPLARVTLNKMRIETVKKQYSMNITIHIQHMDGSFYYLKEKAIYETHLIGIENDEKVTDLVDLIKKDSNEQEYVDIDLLDSRLQEIQNYFNKLEDQGDKIVREAAFRDYDYEEY